MPQANSFKPLFILAALSAAGCDSASLNWTPADAPKTLQVDTVSTAYAVAFAPGASDLGRPEAARLSGFVTGGGIQPADRVTLSAAAIDPLEDARENRIAALLREQGVGAVVLRTVDAAGARDKVTIGIDRATVVLPDCPNWSKPPIDYTGAVSSNFGCANVTNLGLMAADPADLRQSRAIGPEDAATTTMAVQRYRGNQGWGSPLSGAGGTGARPLPGSEFGGSNGGSGSGGSQ